MKKFLIASISLIILLLILLIVLLCINLSQQQKQNEAANILNQLVKQAELEEIAKTDEINESYRFAARHITKTLNQALILATILQEKDPQGVSSKELTDYFSERLIIENKIKDNKFELNNGMFVETQCLINKCKCIVDMNGNKGPNKKWKKADKPSDIIELELRKDKIAYKKEETKAKEKDIYFYKAIPAKPIQHICKNDDVLNCSD